MRESTHPTDVPGYEHNLPELVRRILTMRYDRVAEFFDLARAELLRQERNDLDMHHVQLAALLEDSARLCEAQWERFERMWNLCKPYLQE